ncbi:MAG TPA: hypothetical protein VK627_05775, partial [Edaphobacter sp.]|nr:hypothetical protein [Edaphobacter sp.]
MTEAIPQLHTYDEPALEAAFATLAEEVRSTSLEAGHDPEAFRLHWLGRKQGRLKLISEAWLKSAPPEAKKALGIRFNQLKALVEQEIDLANARLVKVPISEQGLVAEYATYGGTSEREQLKKRYPYPLDITLPGTLRTPGIPHPLLKTMHEIVSVFHHLG